MLSLENINANGVYFLTGAELASAIVMAAKCINQEGELVTERKGRAEMRTEAARQALLEKGYPVSTYPAFLSRVKSLKITRRKIGKEFFYNTEEIMAVPSRIIKK